MKRENKIIACCILATCILVVTTISCNQNKIVCESCTMQAPNQTLSVDVGKINNIETKIWDEKSRYHFGSSRSLNDEEIRYITHDFLGQPNEAGALDVAVVIYTDVAYNGNNIKTIDKKDIKGYSLFFSKENKFRHRFLLKGDDGVFRIVPELNCETRSISANSIFTIASIYFNDRFKDVSAIEMTDLSRYANILDNKLYRNNTLRSSVKYLERQHQEVLDPNGKSAARPGGEGATCKAPCPPQNVQQTCEKKSSGSYSCLDTFDDGGSPETASAAIAFETGNYSYHQLDSAYNYDLEYEFRDSLLAQYNLGTKLTGYFYGVDAIHYISAANISDITNLLYAVNPQLQKLLDYNKYNIGGSTVFINSTLQTQIIDQINAFKAMASTHADSVMFDDVINDVNTYAGLTMAEVMSTIE